MSSVETRVEVLQELIAEEERELTRLREEIRVRELVLASLHAKLKQAREVPGSFADSTEVNGESEGGGNVRPVTMTDLLVMILRGGRVPMRMSEIVDKVQTGYPERSRKNLNSHVMTTLGRREDLFVKTGRGLYTLKELLDKREE
jgi:hypothetical protein